MPPLHPTTLEAARRAWLSGGSVGLGLWLAAHKRHLGHNPHYTTAEYGALVRQVRDGLDDTTDDDAWLIANGYTRNDAGRWVGPDGRVY